MGRQRNAEYLRRKYQRRAARQKAARRRSDYIREKEQRKRARRRERAAIDPVYRKRLQERERQKRARAALRPGYYEKQRLRAKERRLAKYGFSIEMFETLKKWQNDCCAVCGCRPTKFMIDHNHKTKEVRGLLCYNCNVGLGHFKDSVERLEAAIRYLG